MSLLARIRASGARFARDFSSIGVGQVAKIASRLLGVRLLTELVDPSEFGVAGLTVGMALLARNVFCAPIFEASWRFYADAVGGGRLAEHRNLLVRLLRVRTALAVAALVVGGAAWSLWTGAAEAAWVLLAAAALTVFEAIRLFESGLLNASRRHGSYVAWSVLDEILRFGCAIAVVVLFGPEAVWVVVGYAVGVAAGAAIFWRARVRGQGPVRDVEWMVRSRRQVVDYAFPLSLLAVVGWLFSFSDRYILAMFSGTEATGVYVAAYGLASQPFVVASGIFNLTFRPVYNDAAVRGDVRRERQAFLLWLVLVVAALSAGWALMIWLAEPLTSLLLAKSYRAAAALLPWLGAAYAIQGCKQVFEAVVYAEKRTWLLFAAHVVSASVAVGLYVALVPGMGAMGAALGTLGGMTVDLLGMILMSRAVSKFLAGGVRATRRHPS